MNRLNKLLTATALAGGALGAGGASAPAHADSLNAPPAMTVFYGDLDINNVHGAAVLYQRISFAAETVCRDLGRSRQIDLLSRYQSCVRSAVSGAVAKVGSPALTGYAVARGVVPDGAPIKMKVAQARMS